MRLKVTVVTPIFPIPAQPYRGHSEYQTILALSKYADVNVICPFPRYPKWFQPSFDHRQPDLSYSPPGVATRYFEYPALPGLTRCINGLVCAKYLEAFFRESMPDVAYNCWLYPEGYATVAAARRLGIPAVVCSIGSDLNCIPDPASRWLTRLAMNRAEFVVTKGEYLRQQAIRMGIDARKVRNVPNGCDPSIFHLADRSAARAHLAIDDKAELVLFVGRLDAKKGIAELLKAFASLVSRRPNLRLVYVGDGPGGEQLRGMARDLALEDRVLLMGACPSQKVAQWLASANVLALPSYNEGCPNVVIEALNCGRPVIATDVGGIPELVNEKSGILVAPRDWRALAGAIKTAMERIWDERFIADQFRRGWDDAAVEILTICESAVKQKSKQWPLPAKATTAMSRCVNAPQGNHIPMQLIRNSQIWGPSYVRQRIRQIIRRDMPPLERIWVTFADHYEPMWKGADLSTAQSRVSLWRSAWPEIASRCKPDSTGSAPRYTFFFPEEEYHPTLIEPLAEMVREGIADVEVHLHHDGEGRQNFIDRITNFCSVLDREHGLLRERDAKLTFGFIHGNWALDNSRPDGRWCGLNDEIQLLRDLGCYADFTMPSGDSPTQSRLVNTIYYANDDPNLPKSYDDGIPVTFGGGEGDLLMIPGPLGIRWRDRLLPRLETGEVSHGNVATPYRVKRWVDLAPRIGADSFIKLYTHGTQERNSAVLLRGALESAFNLLVEEANRRGCSIHFASAWQMYLAIDAIRQRRDPVVTAYVRQPEGISAGCERK